MAGSRNKALRTGLLAGAAAALLFATPAQAQGRQRYDLAAGDAAQRVQSLAIQSRVQIIAPSADLAGVRTQPVVGQYTPIEALRRMLAGTGLEVSTGSTGALVVTRASTAAAQTPVAAADAQEPEAGLQAQEESREIFVTGSRIRRPGFDTLEATLVTEAEQFDRRGFTSVMEALDETPGFVPSGVSPNATRQGTFNAGQSFADFFGLGSQRTLTLVNGRRFVSSNTIAGSGNAASPGQQVDLNLIPVGLVERVETIAIGGAPIYGSDAIAGTVNVILKDDFEGVQLTGQYGITERGDAPGYTIRGLGGMNFDGGRGNVAVGAEYNRQEGLRLSARTGFRTALPNITPPNVPSSIVSTDLVFGTMTEGGLPYNPATFGNIVSSSGQPLQFVTGGNLIPFVTGDPIIAPLFYNGGDGVRYADYLTLLAPTERFLVTGIGHYDLTPGIRAFAEVSYARTEGRELGDLAAFADPFQVGNFIPISIDNAFLSDSARATLIQNGVTDSFIIARNLSDLLERNGQLFTTTTRLFRVVAGLEGDFELFGNGASWDIALNYGRSRSRTTTTRIDNDRFLEAINAVRDGSGQIVCASGNAACVPLDIFGTGSFSDAAATYVTDIGHASSLNTQYVATANLSGSLPFRISTQPIDFNIGAEYREERGRFEPDPLLSRDFVLFGFTYASAYRGDSGSFNTKEIYGELSVPIFSPDQDLPIVKSLSFEGAVRYVDNSIAGGDVTWSAGGRFAPRLPGIADGLLFRGVYTRSIRAPAITELFSGSSPTRGGIADPCAFNRYNQGPSPSVREANCRAALSAFGVTPETFNPTTFALSAIGTISGNPDLENEKAKSWSVGAVYQPTRIPGLRLAADWSDIRLVGGIESLGIGSLITACYDSTNFPNEPACDAFRRLAPTEVGPGSANPIRVAGDVADGYRSGYVNVSSLDFSGLILLAEYGFGVPNLTGGGDRGRVQLSARMLHNDTYIFRTTASSPVQNSVGGVGLPDWSGTFNLGYSDNRFDFLLTAVWTDAVRNSITATSQQLADEDNLVGSYWRFNGQIGFRMDERMRLQFIVNNIFDRQPSRSQLYASSFSTYDLLGRRFLVRATVGF